MEQKLINKLIESSLKDTLQNTKFINFAKSVFNNEEIKKIFSLDSTWKIDDCFGGIMSDSNILLSFMEQYTEMCGGKKTYEPYIEKHGLLVIPSDFLKDDSVDIDKILQIEAYAESERDSDDMDKKKQVAAMAVTSVVNYPV